MATLYEYFVKDANAMTIDEKWQICDNEGNQLGKIVARLHLDFHGNAKYVSFYIPDLPDGTNPEAVALEKVNAVLQFVGSKLEITGGFGDETQDACDLVFTGQIYLYSERPVSDEMKARLTEISKTAEHRLTFRSVDYMNERNKWEKPRAFISHDSRDKSDIAQPIALKLQKMLCPVWYDEFSLKVGDSLRESIEQGLKECSKCVLLLTPNFLSNSGWTKREYDSIFTREIVEKQKLILPVWHQISAKDVFEYSPILADRVGVDWSSGVEEVSRKLLQAIDT